MHVDALRQAGLRAASGTVGWLDRLIESRLEDVLIRVNIPSRSDIERLNRSVDLLSAKVEALLNRPASAAPPPPKRPARRAR